MSSLRARRRERPRTAPRHHFATHRARPRHRTKANEAKTKIIHSKWLSQPRCASSMVEERRDTNASNFESTNRHGLTKAARRRRRRRRWRETQTLFSATFSAMRTTCVRRLDVDDGVPKLWDSVFALQESQDESALRRLSRNTDKD